MWVCFLRERKRMCVFVWQTQRHHLCADCLLFVSYLEGFLSLVHSKVATTGILSERRFSAIVLMVVFFFSIAQSVRTDRDTIKPRIEMCTTPKRNKKKKIKYVWLTCLFIWRLLLFCFFLLFRIWSIDPTGGRDRWTHPVPSSSSDPAAGSWRIPPWSCKFWISYLNQKWMQLVI